MFGAQTQLMLPGFCPQAIETLSPDASRILDATGRKGRFLGTWRLNPLSYGDSQIEARNRSNEVVGWMRFEVLQDDRLLVRFTRIDPEYRERGLNTWFLRKILELNPGVNSIKAQLGEDNAEAYWREIGAGKGIGSAVRATPAYKIIPEEFEIDWENSELPRRPSSEDEMGGLPILIMKRKLP